MPMLLKVTKYDILFQYKQGFYLVYSILTAIYLLVLFYLPPSSRMSVSAYLILSDTSMLGIVFIGALVLLEKQQNILQSLFITPLKLSTYLWSKALSLVLIALVVSSLIAFIPGGELENWTATLPAVILSSLFFTFLGLGVAAKVNTLNEYIAGMILTVLIVMVPLGLYFILPNLSLVFPVNATIDLLFVSPEQQTIKGIIADVAVLICWTILSFLFAKRQFLKFVIQK